jgi:succinate-semialdehyde dehydrogenase/glutarate-semialdehyde dehydrogenase
VYVQREVYEPFVERLLAKTRALKVGDGFEEGVEIGQLIDGKALEQALAHVRDATQRGARLLYGGRRAEVDPRGFFLEPTILADVPPDALCMREETFAPVMPLAVFDDEAEVIRQANDTCYGLAAYAFTRDLSRVWRLGETLEAGTIGINDSVPTTSHCPFGGMKQSGWGRELGSEGLDAFLEAKHISLGVQE